MQSATPEYGVPPNVCPACFGIGETPEYVLVFYSGIKIGALWNPGDPGPPNGLHIATAIAACHYEERAGDWDIKYQFIGGRTHCELVHDVVGAGFTSNIAGNCHFWCLNEIVNPAISKYYSGQCVSISPLTGDLWDYPELLALISDNPDWADYLNARSAAGMNVFYNLYKGNSQVNIKIKIDHS